VQRSPPYHEYGAQAPAGPRATRARPDPRDQETLRLWLAGASNAKTAAVLGFDRSSAVRYRHHIRTKARELGLRPELPPGAGERFPIGEAGRARHHAGAPVGALARRRRALCALLVHRYGAAGRSAASVSAARMRPADDRVSALQAVSERLRGNGGDRSPRARWTPGSTATRRHARDIRRKSALGWTPNPFGGGRNNA
jgi:hypothetical protein